MEWLTVVRTCRPEKPGVGLTRQSRCPERTHAYYMEAARERDIHWFNWQLRSTTFHVKNYRNQRKQWIYFIEKLWTKYRMHYNVLTCDILSYLPYDKLPHPRIERLPPIGAYDNLDYGSMDISRVCRMMTEKLVSLGYPRVEWTEPSEMDIYLSYYSSSITFHNETDFFRHLYCMLQSKKIENPWRIIYSHMMVKGFCMSSYDYREGYLHMRYSSQRAEHYFKLWLENTYLYGEPRDLATAWFSRMRRPSIRNRFR